MAGSFSHKVLRDSRLSGGWPTFGGSLARREILMSSSIDKTILHKSGVRPCIIKENMHAWRLCTIGIS
jgi:hypothetical protein